MEVSGKHYTPQGNSPQSPLHRWLGRPQSWSGSSSNEKSLPPPGIKPWFSSHPALNLVTALIGLLSSCLVSVSQWWQHVWHLQHTSQHLLGAYHVFVVAVPGANAAFASRASLKGCSPCSAHNPCQTFWVQVNDKKMNSPCNVLRRTNAYHITGSRNQIHYLRATMDFNN